MTSTSRLRRTSENGAFSEPDPGRDFRGHAEPCTGTPRIHFENTKPEPDAAAVARPRGAVGAYSNSARLNPRAAAAWWHGIRDGLAAAVYPPNVLKRACGE